MGASIERLNLFKICGSFCLSSWLAFMPFIMYSPCRCMADTLCVTFRLFLSVDLRPEPAITTTRYASFACAGIDLSSAIISVSSSLGNDFRYFYPCYLLNIFMIPDLHRCINTISVHGILQSSHLLTIRVYPLSFSTFSYIMHRLCLNVSANIFKAHFFLF